MVGLIQKLLIEMIRAAAGEETVNKIKEKAGLPLDHAYHMNKVYSDEEWQRLIASTLEVLNITLEQAETLYADYFLKDALARFPNWFKMSKNSKELLLIQPTIHNCFATSVVDVQHRDAINDKFKVEKFDNKIITHYRSKNLLCGLYVELARAVINHYKDEATIEQKKCLKKGDAECEIHVQWSKLGNNNYGL